MLNVLAFKSRGFFIGREVGLFEPVFHLLHGDLSLWLLVGLVAKHKEGEVLGIFRVGLDEEILTPKVQILETLCIRYVVNQDAGLSTTVESDTETLIAFLTSCVPDLKLIIRRLLSIPEGSRS
jgi:hypothetical protein